MHKKWAAIIKKQNWMVVQFDDYNEAEEFCKKHEAERYRIVQTEKSRRACEMILKILREDAKALELSDDYCYSNGKMAKITSKIAHYQSLFNNGVWIVEDLQDRGYQLWFNKDQTLWHCARFEDGKMMPPLYSDKCVSKLLREVNEKLSKSS